eukprot:TRINITY_DN7870_c0_g1_i1.p1 TRINITY_DN7870_c0_g1~~TRINITY_DN7870_c0_g1_i1.p1  ORF type:complete len:326 (+),score=56.36 TRINITY_DN7870_c0_g1_i1:102-1079(+)
MQLENGLPTSEEDSFEIVGENIKYDLYKNNKVPLTLLDDIHQQMTKCKYKTVMISYVSDMNMQTHFFDFAPGMSQDIKDCFILFSFEDEAHENTLDLGIPVYKINISSENNWMPDREKVWVIRQKMLYILTELPYPILTVDIDNILMKNPMPYLTSPEMEKIDIIWSHDTGLGARREWDMFAICKGFGLYQPKLSVRSFVYFTLNQILINRDDQFAANEELSMLNVKWDPMMNFTTLGIGITEPLPRPLGKATGEYLPPLTVGILPNNLFKRPTSDEIKDMDVVDGNEMVIHGCKKLNSAETREEWDAVLASAPFSCNEEQILGL